MNFEGVNLITGGGGFIGLNLVQRLLELGEHVVVYDNESTGFNRAGLDKVAHRQSNFEYKFGSVLDPDLLRSVVRSALAQKLPVRVYHLAAESHVDRSISNPIGFAETNSIGTMNVLEVARELVGKVETLVVSTDEVYGDEGEFPKHWDAPLRPSSPYAAAKAAGDLFVEAYRRTYKLPIKLSRCCNNFGKWQHAEKFIPTIIRSIRSGTPVPVYGDGQQFRQWVPAKEHAQRLIDQMNGNNPNQLVGGVLLSNLALIEQISGIIGKTVEFKHVPDRPGHDVKYELYDSQAISQETFHRYLREYVTEELEV